MFAIGLCGLALYGCGSHAQHGAAEVRGSAIEAYLREVEPIRVGVNRLLGGADPVLAAAAGRRMPRSEAGRRLSELERAFAAYKVRIAAVHERSAQLRTLNAGYAETYVLEDRYLRALAIGMARGSFDGLPNTQAEQRTAIIRWRTALTSLAGLAHVPVPSDLEQAGRGEIAPSPDGS